MFYHIGPNQSYKYYFVVNDASVAASCDWTLTQFTLVDYAQNGFM
jgi:hypothetical protein